MEMENRSKKRTLEQEQDIIKLSVKGQDGVNVFFQISRTRPLLKLLQAYCYKRNCEYKAMQFFYNNGLRVSVKRTPDELGMQDGDEIEAMMHQSGGGDVAVRK